MDHVSFVGTPRDGSKFYHSNSMQSLKFLLQVYMRAHGVLHNPYITKVTA